MQENEEVKKEVIKIGPNTENWRDFESQFNIVKPLIWYHAHISECWPETVKRGQVIKFLLHLVEVDNSEKKVHHTPFIAESTKHGSMYHKFCVALFGEDANEGVKRKDFIGVEFDVMFLAREGIKGNVTFPIHRVLDTPGNEIEIFENRESETKNDS